MVELCLRGVFCLGAGCPPPAFGHPRQSGDRILFWGVVLFSDRELYLLAAPKMCPSGGTDLEDRGRIGWAVSWCSFVCGGGYCLGVGCPPPPFGHLRQRRTGILFVVVVVFAGRVLYLLAGIKMCPAGGTDPEDRGRIIHRKTKRA